MDDEVSSRSVLVSAFVCRMFDHIQSKDDDFTEKDHAR